MDFDFDTLLESFFGTTNQPSDVWEPSQSSEGAQSWDDVLLSGFSRWVDLRLRPEVSNTAPVLSRPGLPRPAVLAGVSPLVLIGIAFVAWRLLR